MLMRCINCNESFEVNDFFKCMLNVSSDYKTLTFKCSKCEKSALVNINHDNVYVKSFTGDKSEAFRIEGLNSDVCDGFLKVFLENSNGDLIFENKVEVYKSAFGAANTVSEIATESSSIVTESIQEPIVNDSGSIDEEEFYEKQPASLINNKEKNEATAFGSSKETNILLKNIRQGWITGIISILISSILLAILAYLPKRYLSFEWPILISEMILLIGLVLGLYLKSRVCATTLFFYFIAGNVIAAIQDLQALFGIPVFLVFLYYYFKAMIATYKYPTFVVSNKLIMAEKKVLFLIIGCLVGAIASLFVYGVVIYLSTGLLSGVISLEIILVAFKVVLLNEGAWLTSILGGVIIGLGGYAWCSGCYYYVARDFTYFVGVIGAIAYLSLTYVINKNLFQYAVITGSLVVLFFPLLVELVMKRLLPEKN